MGPHGKSRTLKTNEAGAREIAGAQLHLERYTGAS